MVRRFRVHAQKSSGEGFGILVELLLIDYVGTICQDVYSVDFDMFGYSAEEYLGELGLRGKLEKELERR